MNNIPVSRPSMPPMNEYVEEIKDIWDSHWLTHTGPKHQELTRALLEKLGGISISLFCNGHQALEAAFSIFSPGKEVITTPFTFASTTMAIMRCGLVPVFCDIEPTYYTMDPEKIESLITEKTVAIAPVHVYGNLCDWRKIREIAKRHRLKVIYDAAHAFGVKEGKNDAGMLGDLNMFSFHATKVFHTIEGGCLLYNDRKLAKRFAAWRQYGMYDGEQSEIMGTNAKLIEFAAAMGLCNLRHLDGYIAARRAAVLRYRERLSDVDGLILCPEQPRVTSNYAYFSVQVDEKRFGCSRDQLVDDLAEQGIFCRKYFYPLTSQFPVVKKYCSVKDTPVANKISNRIVCLPLFSDLSMQDVDCICDAIINLRDR